MTRAARPEPPRQPASSHRAGLPVAVGIWGSCVTRDTFEIGGTFDEPLAYHARSSWVSQATSSDGLPPVGTPSGPGFADRMVREDLEKSVLEALTTKRPDLVVIDLIDERFDLVSVGGAYYSMSDYYERLELDSSMREASDDVLAFRDDERDAAFERAVDALVPRWLEALPNTRFVLHQAWYTARTSDPGRPFYPSAPIAVAWCNERLAHHYRCLIEAFGGRLHVVEADRDDLLVADPDHKWGLAHYHYVTGYYEQVLTQILEVRVGADRTRTPSSVVVPSPAQCGAAPASPRMPRAGVPDRAGLTGWARGAVPRRARGWAGRLVRAVRSAVRARLG